jgi:hypothetical protein
LPSGWKARNERRQKQDPWRHPERRQGGKPGFRIGESLRLALAHLAEDGPSTLFGLAGLALAPALLLLETLDRYQKPGRFWFAKYHGGLLPSLWFLRESSAWAGGARGREPVLFLTARSISDGFSALYPDRRRTTGALLVYTNLRIDLQQFII